MISDHSANTFASGTTLVSSSRTPTIRSRASTDSVDTITLGTFSGTAQQNGDSGQNTSDFGLSEKSGPSNTRLHGTLFTYIEAKDGFFNRVLVASGASERFSHVYSGACYEGHGRRQEIREMKEDLECLDKKTLYDTYTSKEWPFASSDFKSWTVGSKTEAIRKKYEQVSKRLLGPDGKFHSANITMETRNSRKEVDEEVNRPGRTKVYLTP